MGHKVNATSFRIKKNWDSSYFLNNSLKLKNYIFEDISIRKYIERICIHQDKIILNFKTFRDNKTLVVFLKVFYWKNYRNKFLRTKKKNKLAIYYNLSKLSNLAKHIKFNLQKFLNNFDVLVYINQAKTQKKFYKPLILKKLETFKYNTFFRKSVNFIRSSFETKSSKLLGISIARSLERTPKHVKFLSFLKKLLSVFINFFQYNRGSTSVKGYRIEINGKFNGKGRAKKKVIAKGPMPLSTIDANVVYSFSEAFTKYGTFGVKVWFYIA
jgi:hypothetical protein